MSCDRTCARSRSTGRARRCCERTRIERESHATSAFVARGQARDGWASAILHSLGCGGKTGLRRASLWRWPLRWSPVPRRASPPCARSTSTTSFSCAGFDRIVNVHDVFGVCSKAPCARCSCHFDLSLRNPDRISRRRSARAPADPGGTSTTLTVAPSFPADRAPSCSRTASRDLVRFALAFVLVQQVHLDVALVRAASQVVLADETVEVDRRGSPGVELVVGHFRYVRLTCCGQCVEDAQSSLREACLRACRPCTWNSLLLSNGSIFMTTALHEDQAERNDDQAENREQQDDDGSAIATQLPRRNGSH